ncbi:hypothetical protein CLAIMM_11962 [Cladophialophora immunda]|nr:hypothetical protein CLAIMM_11962 [Cladophialophora immunda]
MGNKVRVGAIQAEPVWLDLQGGVRKVVSLIEQAAKDGINVLGFPEVFIPGYPWSITTEPAITNTEFVAEYQANSLGRESAEMDKIRASVKKAGIFVVLGYSERARGSLYMAQSFIDPSGAIVLHRRKIKPTYTERAVWGEGQADSLTNVIQTPHFGRIGALNCWEHFQPLLRYNEYCQGVDIHVASWPLFWDRPENLPGSYNSQASPNRLTGQFMAMEGSCFVLVATQILTEENRERTKLRNVPFVKTPGGGFAMIFGPDGKPLVPAFDPGHQGILAADIDLGDIDYAKQVLDVVGHYSRPDLLSLNVNKEPAKHVHYV